MFGNTFKTAVRHLAAQKLYTAINVLGLSVGLTCTLLIGLYVRHELSYERFFADAERIYRISRDYYPTEFRPSGRTPASVNAPFGPQLKADFPQIEEQTRLFNFLQPLVRLDGNMMQERDFMFVDQSFPRVFSLQWLAGDPASALAEPYSVVLTESLAQKYFGDANAVGRTLDITLNDDIAMQVTGVIRDLPHNSHLRVNALASMSTLTSAMGEGILRSWQGNTDFHTYIKLLPGADIAELERQFPAMVDRYVGEGVSAESGLSAMKLTDIHLHSTRTEELTPPGDILKVYAFIAIAAAVLLIACINFMNLSTARSSQRAREVGMRKAIGAGQRQLVRQFLGESLILGLLAMLLAVGLVSLLVPGFSAFAGKALEFAPLSDLPTLGALLLLVLAVGLAAGSYPAFFLAAFKPARVLRGEFVHGSGGARFRQALVVLQFAVAIALVACTAVIYTQVQYARSIDLGLDKEQVVVLSGTRFEGLGAQWPAMKQELLRHSGIVNVTSSHYTPFTHDDNSLPVLRQQGAGNEVQLIKFMAVDYDFFQTYGIEVVAGRAFSEGRNDRIVLPDQQGNGAAGGFIVNEAVARQFGWNPEEAVDQVLWLDLGTEVRYPIIGVAENSYFESLTRPLEPLIFFVPPPGLIRGAPSLPQGAVRLSGNDVEGALAHIDAVWREFLPELPPSRHFLNEDFEALYQAETQQSRMLTAFSILAIFIACLGLYGLASFNAERRTREIGVRKVMGGSVWSIVLLLTNDFSKLVLLANVIAWPVAWFAMNRWLENFAYRIDLTPMIFIGSGLIALCIAWVTVGGTAAKAARAKPVLALRYE